MAIRCGREGLWWGEFLVVAPRRVREGGGPILSVLGWIGVVGDGGGRCGAGLEQVPKCLIKEAGQ